MMPVMTGMPVASATVALKKNGATIDTTTSDANGIYAFIASAGTYLVVASKDGSENSVSVSLADTTGTSIDTTTGSRGSYGYGAGTIGNSYGNDIALTDIAATPAPVFDPDDCLFYPTTNVTITCADPAATIRYTLDGTAPTESSTAYTGPILVEDTVTISARAFSPGKNASPVVAATYTYDAAQGAPKGDYFADPIAISGANGTRVIDDNSAYTVENDEPYHTLQPSEGGGYIYNFQYHTVWYLWTAPGSGTMTFQTSCSGGSYRYPTYLAVYSGNAPSLENRLAFETEHDNSWVTSLSLSVEQGTTYRIVGMVCSAEYTGTFTLHWSGDLTVARTPYETWAEGKVSGGPEVVSDGVANAFRYVFNRPAGVFSPISSITLNASGQAVLGFPPIVNTDGATLKILSTSDLRDWSSGAVTEREVSVGADGTMTLPDIGSARFFRLRAIIE